MITDWKHLGEALSWDVIAYVPAMLFWLSPYKQYTDDALVVLTLLLILLRLWQAARAAFGNNSPEKENDASKK